MVDEMEQAKKNFFDCIKKETMKVKE